MFGGRDSHPSFVTHAGILTSNRSTAPHGTASALIRTLSYHNIYILSIASVLRLAPVHFRRMFTRPVSYYALFKGVAASKPTSWMS